MNFARARRMQRVTKSVIRQLVDRARPDSINLGLGEPAFATPDFIRSAAQEALNLPRLSYTANAGLLELRRLIAEKYHCQADQVCVTSGSQEALTSTFFALLDEGDRVLLPDPGFLAYPSCAYLCGAEVDYYRLARENSFAFSLEAFRAGLCERTKLVVLNSPSNPTGQILTTADLMAIADELKGSNIWVLSDEIYSDLYFETAPRSIAEFYPQTIIISGLSKSMSMTGWRLGWAVADRVAIEPITVMHQYLTTCAPTLSQRAALSAFGPAAETSLDNFRAELRTRRDLLARAAREVFNADYLLPAGAFYLMLDVRSWGNSFQLAERLLDYGVITIPGSAFGPESEGFLRLSFSLPIEQLLEGIKRLGQGLAAIEKIS